MGAPKPVGQSEAESLTGEGTSRAMASAAQGSLAAHRGGFLKSGLSQWSLEMSVVRA